MANPIDKPQAFEARIRLFFSTARNGRNFEAYREDFALPEGSPLNAWCPMYFSLENSVTIQSNLWEYAVAGVPMEVNPDGLLAPEFTCRLCGVKQPVDEIGMHLFEHGCPTRRIVLDIGVNPYDDQTLAAAVSMVEEGEDSHYAPRKYFWIPIRLILSKYFCLSPFGPLHRMLTSEMLSILEKYIPSSELNHIFYANHFLPGGS